ncbi:ArnT family glycosyltransferase [Rheinheimera marina]|uniref:ArnT family glycosyltransferase n=1 Tax=Rheinheimera marina TaxID=1774958 RepID=A0ABV9JQ03_9GAMM
MMSSAVTATKNWLNARTDTEQLQLLMLLALVLICAGLGLRDPWPADEPRFALIAKEMVESGDWFFPRRAGEYYADKPPIFLWCIAFWYQITGSLNLAFLLPSALAAMFTLYLVVDLGRKLWNSQTGLIAGLLLVFSLQFMLQAKTAQIDALVCGWITLGCYGLLRFMLIDGNWRWYYLAWAAMGFGVITKGVGFLPALMLVPYLLYRTVGQQAAVHSAQRLNLWRWLAGPVVMLLAICCWFVPMWWFVEHSQDPQLLAYRDNILWHQTVTRYANSWHHLKPFWYYLVSVIPVFWLPLSLALPWLVPRWTLALKQWDGRVLLPLGWILLLLLFFSLSPGKRGVYIFPALPMLALIAAPYTKEVLAKRKFTGLLAALTALIALALAVSGLAGLAGLHAMQKLADKFDVAPWSFLAVLGGAGLVLLALSYRRRRWLSWPLFVSTLWLLYSFWGYPMLEGVKTPKHILSSLAQQVRPGTEVVLVDFAEQFVLFSPFPITHFGFNTPNDQQLWAAYQWQSSHPEAVVLLNFSLLDGQCYDPDKAVHLGFAHRADWVMLDTESRRAQCPAPAELPVFHYKAAGAEPGAH